MNTYFPAPLVCHFSRENASSLSDLRKAACLTNERIKRQAFSQHLGQKSSHPTNRSHPAYQAHQRVKDRVFSKPASETKSKIRLFPLSGFMLLAAELIGVIAGSR